MSNPPVYKLAQIPPHLQGAIYEVSTPGQPSNGMSNFFTYHDVIESPVPSSTLLSARQGPAESQSASSLERTLQNLSLDHKLCETCKLLDLEKLFYASTDEYKFPESPTNFHRMFGEGFCWSVFHMLKEKECRLCLLIMSALCLNPRFKDLKDGVVVARRKSLYSKETDVSLPNFHFLSLSVSEGEWLPKPANYGCAIGIQGRHRILLPNTVKSALKHFYPWLPPGMVPMSTTEAQAKAWDAWRLETAVEYEVSVRRYDPHEADINTVMGWLKCCEEEHTKWCTSKITDNVALVPGFRVIDVVSGNLVEQPDGCRYLALSYVWGEVHRGNDYLRLLQGNHDELKEIGGLFKDMSRLPRTIRDAIALCEKIDERYLWIDSLCIIQDSPEDMAGQISRMDTIYRRAFLCIVAAAGTDANAGLPGVTTDLPRTIAPEAFINNFDLVAIPEDGEFELNNSKWNSRAWTFQERVLSTRLLRFTSNSLTFECQSACWREDFTLTGPDADRFRLVDQERKEQETRQNFHHIISADILQFENMMPRSEWHNDFQSIWSGAYSPLVRDYTKRKLTFEGDMLNAFQGIEGALRRSLGEFHWGLPLYLLAQSLGWIATTDDVKRHDGFPSFSWTGWVFGDGNWGSYPEYLRAPFPGLIVVNEDSTIKFFSDGCQHNPYSGIYEWHDAMLYPSSVEMSIELDKILSNTISYIDVDISLLGLVLFWTSAAAIKPFAYESPKEEDFDDEECEESLPQRTEILKGASVIRQLEDGLQVGGLLEYSEMREISVHLKSHEVDLVYIGMSNMESGKWCLILVRWENGIARRILPQVLFHIDAEDWENGNAGRKLIILG
ncbi:hypothetical protein VTL71DRAFT_4877 [Oculimacula yallundae]|uniref:Heterokaryon incompatibility domain-containing protein n=1 Tax=Oculimacula yallundae TaxID=86028 RepID=A0ABR4C3B8_9HELO